MKTRTKISRFIALTALAVSMLMLGTDSPRNEAQTLHQSAPALAQKASDTTAPATKTDSTKFDGAALYKEAFESLRDRHIQLLEPKVRAAWVAEWQNKHANDGKLATEQGTDEAVLEMMRSLNQRYDYYFLPEKTAAEEHSYAPSYSGTGLGLTTLGAEKISKEHPLWIAGVIDGSPASRLDLRKKDRIVAIDGKSVDGMTPDEAVKVIKGQIGVPVVLSIERGDLTQPEKFNVTIVRADYVRKDVHTKDLGDGIAYIKLDDFMSQFAVKEMFNALTAASKNSKGVILDLRGNHGGRLDFVEAMAQFFLEDGTILEQHQRVDDDLVILRTAVQPGFAFNTAASSSNPDSVQIKPEERMTNLLPKDMPVVVLIDGDSYSAAEILSGALQANHRATVIGAPSGGKGVGQVVIKLPFGRSMHVTSFEFLPGGKAMDWIGVIPDIQVKQPANFDADDSTTDAQLKAAMTNIKAALDAQQQLQKQRDELRLKNETDFKKSRE